MQQKWRCWLYDDDDVVDIYEVIIDDEEVVDE